MRKKYLLQSYLKNTLRLSLAIILKKTLLLMKNSFPFEKIMNNIYYKSLMKNVKTIFCNNYIRIIYKQADEKP